MLTHLISKLIRGGYKIYLMGSRRWSKEGKTGHKPGGAEPSISILITLVRLITFSSVTFFLRFLVR